MGEASLDQVNNILTIHSAVHIYGDCADASLAITIADDIARIWNEPEAFVRIRHEDYVLKFQIEGIYAPDLKPEDIWYNDNPRLNFFRIEEYSNIDISFVDALGSNTGYFKIANLRQTSTTSAHEYGHTLGLEHPTVLDIRGKGIPGIMYPRGTLCDPQFQYDPNVAAGQKGGTLDPQWRKVLPSDVDDLRLHRLLFNENGMAVVGEFTSIYHEKHIPS
ncbi:peptidase M10 [Pseudoflavitalea sp. G-6-1-2]|uniref:peptidase M10 n=1 Tax=Pseudoflavitalea sp. G-6-1-2 TaxID=2728841 RepID=UPI00146C11E0|nr:peptidase M10 [Pseudoflavitalea sp. G-6-1-2]NML20760.1 peptidase M10 [Pseudoflavitalea sp. G-6-1-2]